MTAPLKALISHFGHGNQEMAFKRHVVGHGKSLSSTANQRNKVTFICKDGFDYNHLYMMAGETNLFEKPDNYCYIHIMIAVQFPNVIFYGLLAFVAQILLSVPASAAISDWQDIGGGKARMVATLSPETGRLTGVVQIQLNEGWKTYWRSPGDSGIPPQFSFSRSDGFVHQATHLPAPEHIIGKEATYVGYSKDVDFLFEGELIAGVTTGKLVLDLFLGVCEEVCIPAQASFEVPLGDLFRTDTNAYRIVALAESRLPGPPTEAFRVSQLKIVSADTVEISVAVPNNDDTYRVFVEGPSDWYLLPPKLQSQKNNLATFLLNLTDIPEDADLPATRLRLTVASHSQAIEDWRAPQ